VSDTDVVVSILLPTFNRARFLPEAFDAIAAQRYRDWELIVVDDGSTDDTEALVQAFRSKSDRPVKYIKRPNGGAYAARNTGLDHAAGTYIAYYDSDDLWLPHHLERCVSALVAHPEIDWVYGACRAVDTATGSVLQASTFRPNGRPQPFLELRTRTVDGDLRMFDDPGTLDCQLTSGLYCGLQNSVLHRRLFASDRFWEEYKVVDDVLFVVRRLAEGARLAYFDDVHVIYRVHQENSSASATGASAERLLPVFQEQVRGMERVKREVALPAGARRALDRRLAHLYFWHLGYAGYWPRGDREEALKAFSAALRLTPGDLRMWKTYVPRLLAARLRKGRDARA
jgi:glycosyltransferase involved in cell wall biosynthesis